MVKVSYYGYKVCGSQRDKAKIVALWACKTAFNKKSAEQGTSPYSALKVHYIGVLSDDFAAVDFREDYANLSLPKEAKFKRCRTIKTNERKPCAAEKRQPVPKRVSGDGSAPPRFLVAVNFAFRRLAGANRPLCSVTSPLPEKSLHRKSFSGTLLI